MPDKPDSFDRRGASTASANLPAVGRPRKWAREDLLLVAWMRSRGSTWGEIGAALGTSRGRAHTFFSEPTPIAREPSSWQLLKGDRELERLFRKCSADQMGSRARAAGPGAPGPGRARGRRTSEKLRRTPTGRKRGRDRRRTQVRSKRTRR